MGSDPAVKMNASGKTSKAAFLQKMRERKRKQALSLVWLSGKERGEAGSAT